MKHAPVVLFTYNRPWHTQQTINTLVKNEYASDSDLIIYSDAHRDEQNRKRVEDTRKYLKTISGFKSITVIEREENMGG
jgi:GT2 family glycosyltransferase